MSLSVLVVVLLPLFPLHSSERPREGRRSLVNRTATFEGGRDTTAAAAAQLFAALRGSWSCSGARANGQAVAADLTFTPAMGGRTLHFHHADRPPTTYIQDATWGVDSTTTQIVSLAFAGTRNSRATVPMLFVATAWTPRSVTLAAQPLTTPPWAQNRFTYTVDAPDSLRVVWEVERGGTWKVGDQLTCHPRAPAR
jgi:hypothetical protein